MQKNYVQNILMWLSGRAVKTQLQIVLIRLFAATDGYPISVKNEFLKMFFYFIFGSYLHDFIWPQCLLLWLDISLRKMS